MREKVGYIDRDKSIVRKKIAKVIRKHKKAEKNDHDMRKQVRQIS